MKSWIKKITLSCIICFLLMLVSTFAYCWYLSLGIEQRLSGRKWQIPSTIYSDATLLYPGKKVNLSYLPEKLKNLGYQRKDALPDRKGEYFLAADHLNIYLNDLNLPGKQREGFQVSIDFEDSKIMEMWSIDNQTKLSLLELAPEVIMQIFGAERELRKIMSIDTVPDYLIKAVVATEDSRFFSHFGIDPIGILRAMYTNIRYGSIRQGGSTLTQQLAKNYFLTHERTLKRKVNELFISFAIELKYTKEEKI